MKLMLTKKEIIKIEEDSIRINTKSINALIEKRKDINRAIRTMRKAIKIAKAKLFDLKQEANDEQ